MKKIKYILFFLVNLLFVTNVYANDIKKITMDIYIDNNGTAYIKEKWLTSLKSGTEGYKTFEHIGYSEIQDYKVTMNGKEFTTLDKWDVDASFNEKKYKAGIRALDDGVELCFGISDYGMNTYNLEYTITNFVVSTKDSDMIFWNLISKELTDKPEYYYIKIYSDFDYDKDTPIWGYGAYGNYNYVDNGYIELTSDDGLESDEYIVLLAKFPKKTFNTSVELEENFDYYLDMAKEGSTQYSDKLSFWDILKIIFIIIGIIFSLVVVIICILNYNEYGTLTLRFKKGAKNLKEAPYFRDIPAGKNIFKAYWLACQYKLVKNKTDFLGAILLKWLKEHVIENVTVTTKILKKEERAIKFISSEGLSGLELELYEMMYTASIDGVLESNEFTSWCKKNYDRILKWFNQIIDNETLNYVSEGKITSEKKIFGNVYIVGDNMKYDALQMAGLKKFLNEFSNIKERESIEVSLWEEYLMYAQIFGIAKKVAKEFKKLYPDIITDETYNDVVFIHTISYNGVSAASSAKIKAENYSAGGGGFSSGGGGHGSFGGGGGGFR